jgi:hypothetical protein
MNDRELLELAAKAAGISPKWIDNWRDVQAGFYVSSNTWNPLESDGDALRLAVKLHLTCRHFMGETVAQSTVPGGPSVYITDTCHRRAIVRAAAEIGKAMP